MSNDTSNRKDLAFVLLVGGKSARFGSDKGLYEFLGKPFVSYQLDTLSRFNINIFLVVHSKEQLKKYVQKIEYQKITGIIFDDLSLLQDKELRSPMIGLYSALIELSKLEYEKIFLFSCDMPLIKYDIVEMIINEVQGFDCCIPRWENSFLEPLFAIYPVRDTLKRAKENVVKGTFRLLNILSPNWKINYVSIEKELQPLDPNLLSFLNINAPIDLEKFMKMWKTQSTGF